MVGGIVAGNAHPFFAHTVAINGHELCAIIDTAAAVSVIREDAARKITFGPFDRPKKLVSADGTPLHVSGAFSSILEVDGELLDAVFQVVPKLNHELLLGIDVITRLPFSISCKSGEFCWEYVDQPRRVKKSKSRASTFLGSEVQTDDQNSSRAVRRSASDSGTSSSSVSSFVPAGHSAKDASAETRRKMNAEANFPSEKEQILSQFRISEGLTELQKEDIRNTVLHYFEDLHRSGLPGRASKTEHRIITTSDSPTYQHPYRTSLKKQEFIRDEVQKLLTEGKIRKSNSPYGAPVVLPVKKDGSFRFAIDYRRLNKVTKKDGFPMPRMDDLLDRVADAQFFALLDAKSGYHQIPLAQEDIHKSAFVTADGQYEWLVMPFGLCNASATFQRYMNELLDGLIPNRCVGFIDDVLVFGASWEDFLCNLHTVLSRLAKGGILLNLKKCSFGNKEIEFLGHVISPSGIRPNPEKAQVLRQFPVPQNRDDLRRFLGLAGYFSKFIEGYAGKIRSLTSLLKLSQQWHWSHEEQAAFERIKKELVSAPTLVHFDPSLETQLEVYTDASGSGIGASLLRVEENGKRSPVSFASRALSDIEQRYNTTEKEALALTWAICEKFYVYLEGRHFTAFTDHAALCGELKLQRPSTGRLARMMLKLQAYDFTLKHSKAKDNQVADALSRIHDISECANDRSSSLRQDQENDAELAVLINILRKHPHERDQSERKRIRGLNFHAGLLCYGERIVLPQCHRRKEIMRLHEGSHFGPKKTIETARMTFWWNSMARDIREYCRSCSTCQKHNPSLQRKPGFLKSVQADNVFDVIGVDFVGPFGRKPPRHLITAIDIHSRYGFSRPAHSQDADSVIDFLSGLFHEFGFPRAVITDNAAAFSSEKFRLFCSDNNIEHRNTSVNRGQANGTCEKFNGTIVSCLAKFHSRRKAHWSEGLPQVVAAYNQAYHMTIGMTPFEAFFQREPRTSVHNRYGISPKRHATNLKEVVNSRVRHAHERSRIVYNSKRRPAPVFVAGEKVLLKEGNRRRRKLDPRWNGPHTIEKQLFDDVYQVDGKKINVDRLKPFLLRGEGCDMQRPIYRRGPHIVEKESELDSRRR